MAIKRLNDKLSDTEPSKRYYENITPDSIAVGTIIRQGSSTKKCWVGSAFIQQLEPADRKKSLSYGRFNPATHN
jgi:hypothetical protein